jgi:hypothetical protein
MITFDFERDEVFRYNEAPLFVPLGRKLDPFSNERDHLSKKLSYQTLDNPTGIWGTLGWAAPNRSFVPKGKIEMSEGFNDRSSSVTLDAVKDVRSFLGADNKNHLIVKERFINLSNVEFDLGPLDSSDSAFTLEELPMLRLTLFLSPNEGATVFYQHSKRGNYNDDQAGFQYILPNSTDLNYSTDRDRLHYEFPIIPSKDLELLENGRFRLKTKASDVDFIIKILTYVRDNLNAGDLLRKATEKINEGLKKKFKAQFTQQLMESALGKRVLYQAETRLGGSKYAVLIFDPTNNEFYYVKDHTDIDKQAKTLILNHGTFSSTKGSYGQLYGSANLLQRLVTEGKFQQILAFDHPTASHDVETNTKELYRHLGSEKFSQPVSLMGTSRGALVAKWLSSDPRNKVFEVDRIMTFSGAYGVDYFTAGKHVATGLSALRYIIAPPAGTYVAALAQFSANFILELPGLNSMAPGGDRLKKIMETPHRKGHQTTVQCVVADWSPELAPKDRRWASRLLDLGIKGILGWKHDWVVGFEEQKLGQHPDGEVIEIKSVHVKNFDRAYHNQDTHEMIYQHF